MALKFKSKERFVFLISILVITNIAILLNIPFLRQVLGFLFLTILPGLLILHVLKLTKLDFLERFILTWGLSISFLLFFGLLVNNISLALGYETPLATIPLLISFNIALIALGAIGCKTNKEPLLSAPNFNLSASEKAFLIVPILFPALSVFGMHLMNTTDNNIILMFMLFLIPIYVAFVSFFNRKFPKRLYPGAIFLISISLLLLLSLRSNHLIGSDVHTEYHIFLTTFDNLHWIILKNSPLDACLSISLLPVIYQSILNINPEFLYKILFSLLCSVFPLVIYVLSKKYIGDFYAFLASMFFMFNHTFLWTEYYTRGNIALLFLSFAMMTLFNDGIEPLQKRILFIVFVASCVVSHYSTTYAFFFVMLATLIGQEILSKKYPFKRIISLTTVLLLFAMLFFWYSQVAEIVFTEGVSFIERMFRTLNEFFVMESRRDTAQLLFGKGELLEESIVYKIHWLLTWLTFVVIGIGVLTLIIKRKEMSFPERKFKKPDFLKAKFDVGYFVISLVCVGLLVSIVSVPLITKGYGVGRAYPMASTILSAFFVIGGIMIAKNLSFLKKHLLKKQQQSEKIKRSLTKEKSQNHFGRGVMEANGSWAYLVILLVLIPYFLCVTGAMHNIFGVPEAITLNSEGRQYDQYYLSDHQIIAGKWLSSSEVVGGRLVNKQKTIDSLTEYLGMFDEKSRIYNNGGSEVFK